MKFAHILLALLLSPIPVSQSAHAQAETTDPIANPPAPEGETWGDQNKAAAKKNQPVPATDAVQAPNMGPVTPASDKASPEGVDSINPSDPVPQPKKPAPAPGDAPEVKTDAPAAAGSEAPVGAGLPATPTDKPVGSQAKPAQTPKAAKPAVKPNSALNTKPAMPQGTAIKDPSAADLSDDLRGNPNTSTNATRARSRIRSSDVGLSPEQTNAIIEIRKTAQSETEKRLTEELRVAKTDMNAAMMDSTPADEVRRKFELVQKKYLELQRIKFDRTLKIREVLSIDQRKKLQGLKNSH